MKPTHILPTLLLLSLLCAGLAGAATLEVPSYACPTIQAGVDAAAEGDTVLVAPGTYYENIDLTGKNITLASHYLTTGDTTYVHDTVIDANKKGTVIAIDNEDKRTSPRIVGFTLQNAQDGGDGTTSSPLYNHGYGILCRHADAVIENMIIKNNTGAVSLGGGFYCYESDPVVRHCVITGNRSGQTHGALYFNTSNPILEDVAVFDNEDIGICFRDCESATCERVVVIGNSGEGIYCSNSKITL